ncbi:Bug family tripartite tricarboxylate transporter substrate binding protein [Piscinibacter sp.]|uniref:Bug family tripartite tricarboxylate transporter substrate binding protein n=1 Tax=Piscinibacter sp. TaxID=1903157 RepID=UPI002CDC22FD|nr:tripartite tricarboxylate transporter substrate binding protein [Albitalea sp.]HUG21840.1 tripartite tricarboxylate transporter substrate binding protein [Albitalea sp.]
MNVLLHLARRTAFVLAASLALAATAAQPAGYPEKPIRLLVPYPPGGSTDVLGRALAELMRQDLGQMVFVENKPGANTGIAAQALAVAPPDGYTLLLATAATVVLNPLLYPKLPYEPTRDFEAVARLATTPLVLVVRPDAPAKTLADMIATAKAQPGSINYASTGNGSSLHLAGELLQIETGTQMVHVPYKGSAPALTGVLGGETHFFIDAVGSSIPLIKGGKLRALAVTSGERLQALGDVPTVAESGYPRFEVSTWFGVMAPKNTPEAVLNKLNATIARVAADKAFREQFEALGLIIPQPMKPGEFTTYIRSESARWAPLIKAKGITLE